jgi:hypothetical protein
MKTSFVGHYMITAERAPVSRLRKPIDVMAGPKLPTHEEALEDSKNLLWMHPGLSRLCTYMGKEEANIILCPNEQSFYALCHNGPTEYFVHIPGLKHLFAYNALLLEQQKPGKNVPLNHAGFFTGAAPDVLRNKVYTKRQIDELLLLGTKQKKKKK